MNRPAVWFFIALFFVVLVWFSYGVFILDHKNLSSYGNFGDSFNIIGVLFSGLALSFLVWTAFMQRRELSETKLALEKTLYVQHTQLRLSKLPWLEVNKARIYSSTPFTDNTISGIIIEIEVKNSPVVDIKNLILIDSRQRKTKLIPRYRRNFSEGKIYFRVITSKIHSEFSFGELTFSDVIGNLYRCNFEFGKYREGISFGNFFRYDVDGDISVPEQLNEN